MIFLEGKRKGVLLLENFFDKLDAYLKDNKIFIENPKRYAQFMNAFDKAKSMFPDAKVSVTDDPIQTGALFLDIEDIDITVRETEDFARLIEYANNFEMFPIENERVKLAICFDNVFKKL